MVKIKNFTFDNDGIIGDAWEVAGEELFNSLGLNATSERREDACRAGAGRRDIKVKKNNGGYFSVDCKQGSSVLSYDNTRRHLVQGSSVVLYAPIIPDEAITVNEGGTGISIDIRQVEYFILTKEGFIEAVKISGLYKEDFISTAGTSQIHMRTFYSRAQGKIMSLKKYNAFIEALYERDITTEVEAW